MNELNNARVQNIQEGDSGFKQTNEINLEPVLYPAPFSCCCLVVPFLKGKRVEENNRLDDAAHSSASNLPTGGSPATCRLALPIRNHVLVGSYSISAALTLLLE